MNVILRPTQLIEVVNTVMNTLGALTVEGEVTEYKVIRGKWVTFKLKDDTSVVPCFMTVWQMNAQIEDGMLVRAQGTPRLREKGFFSFVTERVQPAGEGSIKRAFELLRKKLEAEGLFAHERKRPLPQFPRHIALVTSREAAAYNDFLKVLQERQGGLRISFIDTPVQGEDAVPGILRALDIANTDLTNLDAIILVRGGGSMEDLHAFNDESVVRAVASSRTPTIVGIGHERDVSLAELAADLRASTPSNAAELLVRSREELLSRIAFFKETLSRAYRVSLTEHAQHTARHARFLHTRISSKLSRAHELITTLSRMHTRFLHDISRRKEDVSHANIQLRRIYAQTLSLHAQRLSSLTRILQSMSPDAVLKRGFSITTTKDGKVITNGSSLKEGDILVTSFASGKSESRVTRALPHKKG